MNEIANALYNVGATAGRNDKIALLKACAQLEGFKEVVRFIYNPYIRTGIAGSKLAKYKTTCVDNTCTYRDVIEYFTKHQTGSIQDVEYAWKFINAQDSPKAKNLAIAIVTKDLTIGVTEKTFNVVYGDDFIPKIGIMLGEPYQDFKTKVAGPFIVTEKLDGHRRILVKEEGICRFYTRSGIPDEGLVQLDAEAKWLPDNMVYDGECLAIGEFKSALDLRQATNSIMNSKGTRMGVTFNIFDAVPLCDFKTGASVQRAMIRKCFVATIFKDESIACLYPDTKDLFIDRHEIWDKFQAIKSVPILGIASTEEEILAFAKPIWERAFEGVMLNQMNSRYEIKRSKNLLKVKCTKSYDLPIVDFQEGEGKYVGMLGAFIVDYQGYRVGVGSGLTDANRKVFWGMQSELLGKKIEIDTFGETTDRFGNLSLNAPIFKGVRLDK